MAAAMPEKMPRPRRIHIKAFFFASMWSFHIKVIGRAAKQKSRKALYAIYRISPESSIRENSNSPEMAMAQLALIINGQQSAVGSGIQFALIGLHAARLKIVESMAKTKKSMVLAQRKRFRHSRSGPIKRRIINAMDNFAKANVKNAKDCSMKTHFIEGTVFEMGM
jgi:hypothetical protein